MCVFQNLAELSFHDHVYINWCLCQCLQAVRNWIISHIFLWWNLVQWWLWFLHIGRSCEGPETKKKPKWQFDTGGKQIRLILMSSYVLQMYSMWTHRLHKFKLFSLLHLLDLEDILERCIVKYLPVFTHLWISLQWKQPQQTYSTLPNTYGKKNLCWFIRNQGSLPRLAAIPSF